MKNQLKILHVIVAGQIGGAERFLINLAHRPEQAGADHAVALLTPNPKLRAFFVEAGLDVHDRGPAPENPLAYLWRSWGPRDLGWLGETIKASGADLLHCHTYGSHVLAARASRAFSLPVIRTEHGVRHYGDPSCAFFRHWALKHTTHVVAVSDFVARRVREVAPYAAGKITVVHNGIDLEHFTPVSPPESGPFKLAAVCRLEPVKRLAIAIEALAKVDGVKLDIAGDGVERAMLEDLVRRHALEDRVRFLGALADPRPVIAAADALINTTREEGMPLAILEGAAMQRPAIGHNGGGIPEIVADDATGWLVHEDTVEAFAATIARASANRAEAARLGHGARARAEAAFGINTMCEGYGAVYRDVLSRFTRPAR